MMSLLLRMVLSMMVPFAGKTDEMPLTALSNVQLLLVRMEMTRKKGHREVRGLLGLLQNRWWNLGYWMMWTQHVAGDCYCLMPRYYFGVLPPSKTDWRASLLIGTEKDYFAALIEQVVLALGLTLVFDQRSALVSTMVVLTLGSLPATGVQLPDLTETQARHRFQNPPSYSENSWRIVQCAPGLSQNLMKENVTIGRD
jgi:hypothetical protein